MAYDGRYRRFARYNKKGQQESDQGFKISQVFGAFTSLPRVLRLVWSTQPFFTLMMALLSLLRGITPTLSILVTRFLIDSVVSAIRTHVTTMVWVFVGLQLAVALLDRLLSTLSNIVQQLLQDRVSSRVQILILEKANTLDLAFFEDSEFYDKLRHAAEEANYKPVTMISQTFDLGRTLVTLFSMLFLLLQLAWWLALIAIVVPIPAFIANSHYGWRGYQLMRRQSPERRQMLYFNIDRKSVV